jgi:competence protein ComEC
MLYKFVVSFIAGVVFQFVFSWGWSAALFICLVSGAVFLVLSANKDDTHFAKIFFITAVAFALGILRMSFVDSAPDATLSQQVSQKISFEATISDEPDVRDDSTRYIVRPSNSKSLVLLVADRFPELQYGDKIKVSGKLDLPKNFSNDNGTEFDYISYLSKDEIHFVIYRPSIKKLESTDGNKIIVFLYSIKNIFIEKIEQVITEPNASLLGGVIFGVKQSLGQELLGDFQKVGLIHIVVLSGYNITIIAAGIFYLTSFWGKRNLGFVISVISIILFATMVGWGATVVRACIMAFIAILARFLGRPTDALRWLFIAALFMLLWSPLILFYDPSFQLSFMATLGLILFSPFVLSFISEHKFQKFITTKFGVREIVASTLAVQFFVLPLLVRMSGFISLISFLINPLVLPLVPSAMALGALTGGFGIVPFFGKILSWPFGALSYLITQIIIKITEFAAGLPLSTIQTGSISIWFIFIWYLGYAVLYWKLKAIE